MVRLWRQYNWRLAPIKALLRGASWIWPSCRLCGSNITYLQFQAGTITADGI